MNNTQLVKINKSINVSAAVVIQKNQYKVKNKK